MPLPYQLAILFAIGVITGFINILAGGGSLLSLPALIFLGLPATLANGTNRVAILIQNFAAIAGFHQLKVLPWRTSLLAAPPAIVGAIIGASLAVEISDLWFKRILAAIMIAVLLMIVFDPAEKIRQEQRELSGRRRVWFMLGFFAVGVYGGFIQAGVGFQVIFVMLLAGFDLVVTNAVKVFVIFLFTTIALTIFIMHGQVNFLLGASLGLGSALGAFVATRVAIRKGHNWIRAFVVVMGIIFAAKLFLDSLFLD